MLNVNRKSYLDALRIIACFLVIFNHLIGYHAYQQTTDLIQAFYYMGYTMFTRINVPIFFMISGSLLLGKDISYKDLFIKRILRIVITLFCASFVVYIVSIRNDLLSFDIIIFLRKLLNGEHSGAYWYLYAYLGFLIMLPFMRRIAINFKHMDFILIIVGHFFLATFIPFFNYIINQFGISSVSISGDFSVPLMTTKAFFYPLVGYYIDQVFDINTLNRKSIWLLPVVLIAGIIVSSGFTYHQGINTIYTQGFVQTFDYISAIVVFLLVKWIFLNIKAIQNCNMFNNAVTLVGSLTFGIYLMDPVLKVVSKYFDAVVTTNRPILYSMIWCIFSMTVCGVITYVLKKIPIIKKLL